MQQFFSQTNNTAEKDKAWNISTSRNLGILEGHVQHDIQRTINYLGNLTVTEQLCKNTAKPTGYSHLGDACYRQGNLKEAVHWYDLDLKTVKQDGDRAGEGKACGNLGGAYCSLGEFKAAIDYCERQLQIAEELGDNYEQAKAYCNLGIAHKSRGDFQLAINVQKKFLKISKELHDRSLEGKAYCSLGVTHKCMGKFDEAINYFERCLEVAKKLEDRSDEGKAYANIGNVYIKRGEFNKAIKFHECDLEIAKELDDKWGKGRAYSNLGNAFLSQRDFKTSIEYHELSLEIWEDLKNRSGEGIVYGNLGAAYLSLGDVNKAIHFYELHRENAKELGDRSGVMRAYGNLAVAYDSRGDLKTARSMLESSLKISKELCDKHAEGEIYGNLGQVYCSEGHFTMAFKCFELSLNIAEELDNRPSKATLYGSLGHAYFKLEHYRRARDYFELELKIAKELDDRLHEASACKNLSAFHDRFGDLDEAISYSRCSVKLLNEVRSLLQQKDQWKISLREKSHEPYNDLWRLLLKRGKVKEALHAAEQGRAQALKDLMEKNYALHDKTVTENENIDEILSYLSPNTIFLAIEEKGIAFWVCKKGTEVESRSKEVSISEGSSTFLQHLLETAIQEIGAENVKCEDRSLSKKTDVLKVPVENSPQVNRQTHFLPRHKTALNQLYDFLIGPIQDLFVGNELTFVPEGPLCLVPFPALQDSNGKYLCESFRIRMLPSLTSLKLIANCRVNFHGNDEALLVGDPWVEQVGLRSLPFAREEVQIVGRILNAVPLTGRGATKDEVLKRLSSVALVHIAAHGLFETGEIALAPNPSQTSRVPKEEDYLLTMKDVLRFHLRAKLVVLSCCHSGRGEITAEGVVGIARAFLGAGARSVLVSIWALEDDATLEFMKCFYRVLVKGVSASESLNQAMNSTRESHKLNEVKDWAPFQIIGDDVTLDFGMYFVMKCSSAYVDR